MNLKYSGTPVNITLSSYINSWFVKYVTNTTTVPALVNYEVYPNPTNDVLTIQFSNLEVKKYFYDKVLLLSENSTKPVKIILAQDIFNSKIIEEYNKIDLDVSSLPIGTYYLHMVSGKSPNEDIKKIEYYSNNGLFVG